MPVPQSSDSNLWELRRTALHIPPIRADGSRWTSKNFQVCFLTSGASYCEASTDHDSRGSAFRFREGDLAQVVVDIWMLKEGVALPSCWGDACDEQRPARIHPAVTPSAPRDLRAAPGERSATHVVSFPEGIKLEALVELLQ